MSSTLVPRPTRRLQAARLVGLAVVGVLGMIVTDAPLGHFGASSQVTLLGAIYAAALVALSGLFSLAALQGRRWATWGPLILLSLNIGAFLPALIHDFPVAGAVMLWSGVHVANEFFVADARGQRARRQEQKVTPDFVWIQRYGPAARHILAVSLIANLSIVGFEIAASRVADLTCLLLGLGVVMLTGPFMLAVVRQTPRHLIWLALVLLGVPWGTSALNAGLVALALYQVVAFAFVLARGPLFDDLVQSFLHRPALLLLSTFATMAVTGALVLSFPASARGEPLSFLDALFTATSAACITGLAVLDTASTFSPFGQGVILILIQLGGLGIMVLSTFATILLGGRLALRSEQALEEILDIQSPGAAYELASFIVVATLALEALGAAVLALRFSQHGMPVLDAIWHGVFHAVGAFCHAGFALWPDSLVSQQSDPVVLVTIMALIVVGSVGFSVLAALWLRARGVSRRFSLQTRVVLWMTLALIVLGTLLYALLEWDATLAGMSTFDKWMNALFQSVTLRSGGFNTVDFTGVEQATIAVMMVWMFIGAAPGGTGGGIKVTTLAVLAAALPAMLYNQPRAVLMRRAIPNEIVYRAGTIVTVAGLITAIAVVIMLATHNLPFAYVVFEVVSAVGTVGLSLGITDDLHAIGKWVLIVLMFIGRVGPTSLALALGAQKTGRVTFPEGRLMVG
ncbi:Cation transport protein [Nannocystis exedens]|uniref:Cation transport protein n=1 Tax=Nannocystis exedens TaxID=54 RepID=A0A1I2FNM8_9BACT|nr:potassium transporter TrkG [Nannocystis exedens]PCC74520.1 ATPase [Nannocystis exedens]SFF07084.1 Cation transport protein [Nannocystis exedens]